MAERQMDKAEMMVMAQRLRQADIGAKMQMHNPMMYGGFAQKKAPLLPEGLIEEQNLAPVRVRKGGYL